MDHTGLISDNRGVGYVFEAFAVLAVLGLGVSATILVTGVSPTVIDAGVEQPDTVGPESRIDAAVQTSLDDGSLKQTLLAWDDASSESDSSFSDIAFVQPGESSTSTARNTNDPFRDGQFLAPPETTQFGARLSQIGDTYSINFNVLIIPANSGVSQPTTTPREEPIGTYLIREGIPGESAQQVTTTVTLYDTDQLRSPGYSHSYSTPPAESGLGGETVKQASYYPVPEAQGVETSPVYNTVQVKIIYWRV
jgi:hypothetical protein